MGVSLFERYKDQVGYADADGNMAEDHHAISRYAFLIHGGAISWTTKQQEIILLSTTESRYTYHCYALPITWWLTL